MVRKLVLTLIAVLGLSAMVLAQNRQVSGTVTGADGTPIAGATVMVDGTMNGTTTEANGRFTVSAPANGTLTVSFVGYETASVAIEGRSTVDVTLQEDSQTIDDVVVTGYGVQRKASFTGAASVLGDDAIAKKTDVNFVKALEGNVPGVQMNNSSSMPGVWGSVYVRGMGSLNAGAQPLYVLDGMPIFTDVDGMSANSYIDPMASINPNDIESVTVLKDAAATAIYGSRAANGVIVITTKRGSQGKFNLNVDIKQGITTVGSHNMNYANAFETMDFFARGRMVAQGGTYEENYQALTTQFGWDGKTDFDWVDAVTRSGHFQDYNVSASGQSGSTNYFASLGYTNTEGIIINSGMERFSGRLNLDTKFKMFTFGMNTSYSYAIMDAFSQSTGGSSASPHVGAVSSMKPFWLPYNEDGSYARVGSYNPLAVRDSKVGDLDRTWNQTINLKPYLQVDFGKGIYAKTSLGANISDVREYQYWSGVTNNQGIGYGGLGQQLNMKNMVVTLTNVLGWNYTFDSKHDVSVLFGQEMQRKEYQEEYYSKSYFPFAEAGMRDLTTAASDPDASYYKSKATLASYFMDAHYSYDDKYYVSGSYRRDGSSAFGSDRRWGNFWSVGARWRISGEEFMKGNQTITNAALHLSYGTVGNQDIGWYAARGFYAVGANYDNVPGMTPSAPSNPTLTWEVSNKFDVGFDLSFINRIHLTFDYYNEKTTDMLAEVPLSMTTGSAALYQNIGSMRNAGIEFSINATLMQKRNFTWNFYANLTANKNTVLKLANGEPIESTLTIIEEGRPYHQFKMKEYAGTDYETGRPTWYLNETGDEITFDYNEAAKRYVGSSDPKVLGGFGTNLSWKGLDFNIDFNYRAGNKVFDSGANYTGRDMSSSYRTPLKYYIENSWTETNKNARFPQYIPGDPYYATQNSTIKLYSGDFLRISNISVGYTLPQTWTKKFLVEKMRVYFSVDNVYTITGADFIGYNPETYSSGTIAWQYPATRTFTFGAQITF